MVLYDDFNNILEAKGVGKKCPSNCIEKGIVLVGTGKKAKTQSFLIKKNLGYLKLPTGNFVSLPKEDIDYLLGKSNKIKINIKPFYENLTVKVLH